uniref:Uncharacterized protein n=1 Tax=Physcomitrium patens TaxID=3218 RepID=A0A2K1ICF1_PHYPA|nr:hypothetical protein PHYPA_030435 [Physcomitrium patens]
MAPMADFVDDKGSTKTYLCHDLGYAPREPDDVDDVDDDGIYTPPPLSPLPLPTNNIIEDVNANVTINTSANHFTYVSMSFKIPSNPPD